MNQSGSTCYGLIISFEKGFVLDRTAYKMIRIR